MRKQMISQLRKDLLPALSERGFSGEFPHFRRNGETQTDLLTVQFHKSGGSFVLEVGKCKPGVFTTYWGKQIPAEEIRVWYLNPIDRWRLKTTEDGKATSWFIYKGSKDRVEDAARRAVLALNDADRWWEDANAPGMVRSPTPRGSLFGGLIKVFKRKKDTL